MNEPVDLLKMKIERAKEVLPKETLEAIESVPWREVIYNMRERKGYNLVQLEDLELETELVLCGLVPPQNYPGELATRMKLSAPQTEVLVEEMNELVFKKIREELVKIIGKNQSLGIKNTGPESQNKNTETANTDKPGIKIIKEAIVKNEKDKEEQNLIHSILGQKLTSTRAIPTVKTEYSLGNISRGEEPKTNTKSDWVDPYRLNPGE